MATSKHLEAEFLSDRNAFLKFAYGLCILKQFFTKKRKLLVTDTSLILSLSFEEEAEITAHRSLLLLHWPLYYTYICSLLFLYSRALFANRRYPQWSKQDSTI